MYYIFDALLCLKKKFMTSLIIIVSLTICCSAYMKFVSEYLNFNKMVNAVSIMNKENNYYHLTVRTRIYNNPTSENLKKFQQFSAVMFK